MDLRSTPLAVMCQEDKILRLDQFLALQHSLSKADNLEKKAEELKRDYGCFQDESQNRWQRSANGKAYEPSTSTHKQAQRTDKVKIGVRDLSRDSIARKDFLALMNKLSPHNQNTIMHTLKHVFREDCLDTYVQVLWDQMQRSVAFHELHVLVIHCIQQLVGKTEDWGQKWKHVWHDYVATSQWVPEPHLLVEEDYDEFCDFVKWKKRMIASLHAFQLLDKHGWITNVTSTLVDAILSVLQEELSKCPSGNKVVDAYFEFLMALLKDQASVSPSSKDKLHDLAAVPADPLRPATRFKLYDLQEQLHAKMKPAKKGR